MKVIRTKRPLFVPHNPEKPDSNAMRLVPTGFVALVPVNFVLPKDAYVDLTKVKIKDEGK